MKLWIVYFFAPLSISSAGVGLVFLNPKKFYRCILMICVFRSVTHTTFLNNADGMKNRYTYLRHKTKSGFCNRRRRQAIEWKLVAEQLRFTIIVYRDVCFVRPKKQIFRKSKKKKNKLTVSRDSEIDVMERSVSHNWTRTDRTNTMRGKRRTFVFGVRERRRSFSRYWNRRISSVFTST